VKGNLNQENKVLDNEDSIKIRDELETRINRVQAELELESGMRDLILTVQDKYKVTLSTVRYSMLNAIYEVELSRKMGAL